MSRTDKDKPYLLKMWDDRTPYHSPDCKNNKVACTLTESLTETLLNSKTKTYYSGCRWIAADSNQLTKYRCDCTWCLNGKVKKYGKRGVIKRQLKNYMRNYIADQTID